jgi:hypothetical protein
MIATKKLPVEQKAGDPLGERTIATPTPSLNRSWQPAVVACIGHERGNLAQ